jgi:hypothetical protein
VTTRTETIVKETKVGDDNTPGIVAYRVGQLEQAIKAYTDKFDDLIKGFVTEKELHDAKLQAAEEHKQLWDKVNVTSHTVQSLRDDNEQLKGATKLLKGAVAFLMAVATLVGALWWVKG